MELNTSEPSPISARVITCGEQISLLIERPVLGTLRACRVQVVVDKQMLFGIGVKLDDGTVVVVIGALDGVAPAYETGARILLKSVAPVGGHVHFEHMRERIKKLLEVESIGSFADRAAHHALLFVLEAHDPAVRRERLSMLRMALAPREGEATEAERVAFSRNGVIVRRGAAPPRLVDSARALVEEWMRTSFEPTLLARYTQTTFAPQLASHPVLASLYVESGIAALATSLVQPARKQPTFTVQIQIRVPDASQNIPQPEKRLHVDGVSCPHLKPSDLRTFTLLGGVLLSDVADGDVGALYYVPGGHHEMARWFREEWAIGKAEQVSLSRFPGHSLKAGEELAHEVCLGKTTSFVHRGVQG